MHTITVELAERSYPLYLGKAILSSLPHVLYQHAPTKRIAIVTDRNVARRYLYTLRTLLHEKGLETTAFVISPGERQKSLVQAQKIYSYLLEVRFSRHDLIVALGGGVVGDLAGYVAATYRRGVPFVQVPTTLLAQVESAIGGKVGVNLQLSKNVVGTFYQPKLVLSDVQFLSSLPQREIICGLGEILKYAYLNKETFTFLDHHLDAILQKDIGTLQETISRCNHIKARLISEDERESNSTGGRMVLNLGHTMGHALEQLSAYKLHHGEAVMIGLRWELAVAREAGILEENHFNKICSLFEKIPFHPRLNFLTTPVLLKAIFGRSEQARFVLPKIIGEVVVHDIAKSLVRTVMTKLRKK